MQNDKMVDFVNIFVPHNLNIGENIRLLFEILDYIDENELPALLFFSDFEKAFDSLDHEFMLRCLKHFNFGDSIINWVKLFYSDSKSCTINNGHISDFFPIKRGVRQGCPLSPYLFIICIELLSYEITQNENIKGITYDNHELKNTLFADDATFITDGSEKSFSTLISVLENFSYISGLKLNTSKCSVLRAGSLKTSNIIFCRDKKFIWSSEQAKTLGMVFHNNNTNNKNNNIINIFKSNLIPKVEAFCNCLKQWQHRKLSLLGKITVIKSFAFPKLIYPLTVLPNPPEDQLKIINTSMFEFLWNKNPDKIKRKTIVQNIENGGLKMIDTNKFLKSLKSNWVKRLLDTTNNGLWKVFYNKKINKYGGKLVFESNLNTKDLIQLFPIKGFFQDVILSWFEIRDSQDEDCIGKQILWNNSKIKIQNKPIFKKDWYDRGIQHIEHIYDYRKKEFYQFKDFLELYDLPNQSFLFYTSLISSIPREWKTKLKTESINFQMKDTLLTKILKSKQTNKFLYNYQLQKDNKTPIKAEQKWKTIFNNSELNWKSIYMLPFKTIIDTKLREFQYKYIMRIIPTNTYLFKCKLVMSNLCDFCNSYTETVNHLFWECQNSQQFWSELKTFLTNKNINITFDLLNITFGVEGKGVHNSLINFIIICGKYFIFRSKYIKTLPCFNSFKLYLNKRIEIEKHIALEKDKLEVHNRKWEQFII